MPHAQQSLHSRLWTHALDLVFPPRCVSCGTWGQFLCEPCLALAQRAEHPRCGVCWAPSNETRCADCRWRKPALTAARSVFVFAGPARDAVHALKYDGVSAIAPLLGTLMAERLAGWAPGAASIVSVPLAGPRRRRRGYNQSELLAKEIARASNLPLLSGALVRRVSGEPQVHQPDREMRRDNVRNAFAAGRRRLEGPVLLIDDVMTSGATLDACARVLIDSGAAGVFALTFARED